MKNSIELLLSKVRIFRPEKTEDVIAEFEGRISENYHEYRDSYIPEIPDEDRIEQLLEDNSEILKSICLERLQFSPDDFASLELLWRCTKDDYRDLIERDLIQLNHEENKYFLSTLTREFQLYILGQIPDMDCLVERLQRILTENVVSGRDKICEEIIGSLNESYSSSPFKSRDIALSCFRALGIIDEDIAIQFFLGIKENMTDARIKKAVFYSSKRVGNLILSYETAESFGIKDEVDFERLQICQKIVDVMFSKKIDDLVRALSKGPHLEYDLEYLLTKLSHFSNPIFEYLSNEFSSKGKMLNLEKENEVFCNYFENLYLSDNLFSVEATEHSDSEGDLTKMPLRYIRATISNRCETVDQTMELISHYRSIEDDILNKRRKVEIVLCLAAETSNFSPKMALDFLSEHINKEGESDERILRLYAKICEGIGDLSAGIKALSEASQPSSIELIKRLRRYSYLVENGYNIDFLGENSEEYEPSENTIMYNVHASLPFITSGYTIRTGHIARTLSESGFEIFVNTRLGFPVDRPDYEPILEHSENTFTHQNVDYTLDAEEGELGVYRGEEYCHRNAKSILDRALLQNPSVIISASDATIGLSSLMVARYLGIPFIYEMRGLWALTRSANNPGFENSTKYNLLMKLEMQCANAADVVIAISSPMKDWLISGGVEEQKIMIVPNGVSANENTLENPKTRDRERELVFGYIGSIVPYEGLDLLIDAAESIYNSGNHDFRIRIAGDGISKGDLELKTSESKVSEKIEFVGKIPSTDVHDFYSSVDVIVNPRRSFAVTEIVPALKPLEAMENSKCILCSDVSPNKDLIDDGSNGLLFSKDDSSDLADKMSALILDPSIITRIGEEANRGVNITRAWSLLLSPLIREFSRLEILTEAGKKIPNTKEMVKSIEFLANDLGDEEIEDEYEITLAKTRNNYRQQRNVFLSFLRYIGARNPQRACVFFAAHEELADRRSIRSVITYSNRSGDYANSLFLIDKYAPVLDEDFVNSVSKVAGRHSERFSTAEDIPKIPILQDTTPEWRRNDINVACILDEFSYECFKHEVNLRKLTKENYLDLLGNGEIDFLLAESAWNGNDGEFVYGFTGSLESTNALAVKEILEVCKEYKIPTVFWNKEDPVNYDKFIDIAKLFDFIFTSDSNCVSDYMRDCPNSKVSSLAFACQPTIHNPIRNTLPVLDLCFGGSWYVREHGRRKERLTTIVEGAEEFDLHIFDRNFGTNNRNKFPPRFSKFVKGKLSYSQMRMAYRIYDIMLNTNSVENSPTMFSRRVFEIMASSTPVVSTPSEGMEKLLPEVLVCDSPKEVNDGIRRLQNNEIERLKLGHLGLRNVMNNHTYKHRMSEILDFIGININDDSEGDRDSLVSIICCTNRPQMINNVIENFERQLYSNVEMIVMLQAKENEYKQIKKRLELDSRIKVRKQLVKDSLGRTFNKGLKFCKGDFIAKFDDDDLYGPNYLTDTLDAFRYTDADVVGKYGVYVYDESSNKYFFRNKGSTNRYLQIVMGATIVAKKEVFDLVDFPNRTTGEDTEFLKRCLENKKKIFSSNPFNWILVRKGEQGFHTWDDKGALTSGSSVEIAVSKEDIFI